MCPRWGSLLSLSKCKAHTVLQGSFHPRRPVYMCFCIQCHYLFLKLTFTSCWSKTANRTALSSVPKCPCTDIVSAHLLLPIYVPTVLCVWVCQSGAWRSVVWMAAALPDRTWHSISGYLSHPVCLLLTLQHPSNRALSAFAHWKQECGLGPNRSEWIGGSLLAESDSDIIHT